MAVRKVLTIKKHEKFLRTPSEPVKKVNRQIKELCQDIIDTIADNASIGLAAPQIGVHKRVFGARLYYKEDQPEDEISTPIIIINPKYIKNSDDAELSSDGSLSIPAITGS